MSRELARFNCSSLDAAKAIILLPEAGLTPEQRWEAETLWLLSRIHFPSGIVVDFGCGIGRLAKEIVSADTPVIGVDVSATMCEQAVEYVGSQYFQAISRGLFDDFVRGGLRAQGALAVWILQHVPDPRADIAALASVLDPGSLLYVVNIYQRRVPVRDWEWEDDGIQLVPMLSVYFDLEKAEVMPSNVCAPGAYFARWRRK